MRNFAVILGFGCCVFYVLMAGAALWEHNGRVAIADACAAIWAFNYGVVVVTEKGKRK